MNEVFRKIANTVQKNSYIAISHFPCVGLHYHNIFVKTKTIIFNFVLLNVNSDFIPDFTLVLY